MFKRVRGTQDILPGESLDWYAVEQAARKVFPLYGYQEIRQCARKIAESSLNGNNVPGVVAVKPWRLNERMVTQQGIFLCPTEIQDSFEENLCKALRLEDH